MIKATILASLLAASPQSPEKVRVLATTPDLRAIAEHVGGDRVSATNLAKGPEDPHFIDARPSFIREANRADLFLVNGMGLEVGYAPLLVAESRNPKIHPGAPGYVDCSESIRKLEVPHGALDRSLGDVHAEGNPHYLLDPLNAKVVARTIRDRLKKVDPAGAAGFDARCSAFEQRVDAAMFGPKVLERFSAQALAHLLSDGKLLPFLEERGARNDLAGWAARLAPLSGSKIVCFHAGGLTYMVDRFDLEMVAALESKPGVAPSSSHLASVIETMKKSSVRAILQAVYNPRGAAELVAAKTDARIGVYAHQAGAVPGTEDWFGLVEHNVRVLAEVLGGR
jgi:ABC-type Zn uptake system ZnuABC Zn-binding protein ZnuA